MHPLLRISIALLLSLADVCAATQASDPATNNADELATALITSIYPSREGQATVIHGRLTTDFPNELFPSGFTVLGALDAQMLSQNVAVTKLSEAEARAAVDAAFTAAGWRRAMTPANSPAVGGFVPSARMIPSTAYCGPDDSQISATILPRPTGGSYVKWSMSKVTALQSMGATGSNMCRMFSQAGGEGAGALAAMRYLMDLPMPPLRAPAGLSQDSGGMSSNNSGRTSTATVHGSLSLTDVVGNYVTQIEKAGWTTTGSSIGTAGAMQSFSKTGDGGRRFRGLLVVSGIEAGYELSFQVAEQAVKH